MFPILISSFFLFHTLLKITYFNILHTLHLRHTLLKPTNIPHRLLSNITISPIRGRLGRMLCNHLVLVGRGEELAGHVEELVDGFFGDAVVGETGDAAAFEGCEEVIAEELALGGGVEEGEVEGCHCELLL